MAGLSITAVADDLTGAAEIAAIGHRYGLPAVICTRTGRSSEQSGLTVYDTDSRLVPAAEATLRLEALGYIVSENRPRLTYKKTDSVLRGNVAAELLALARSLGFRRVLLVPANPSLGRTTRSGEYFINDVPLHETAFARDPHHPVHSASLIALLGNSPGFPVAVIKPGDPLPNHGIVLGETATSADVEHWAGLLDPQTLPAGGAEFFEACLKQQRLTSCTTAAPTVNGPMLVITGALTPARQKLLAHAATADWPCLPMPRTLANNTKHDASKIWIHRLAFLLNKHQLAITESPRIALEDNAAAERIRRAFGDAVCLLHDRHAFGHLIVEGGATAAAIAEAAGWSSFDVLGAWAPGVISLRPIAPNAPVFTLKPGSYSWPENLWHQLDTSSQSNAHS